MTRWPRTWSLLLVLVALFGIGVPGLGTLAHIDAGEAERAASAENRTLAPWPPIAWNAGMLMAWPGAAARYFEDHFALRARLVRWQAIVRLEWLRTSPSPDVLVGRDGWLFYAADAALADFASTDPFSREDLEVWRTVLQHTHDWLARRGIRYVFVLAPDKHAVYPEFMPDGVRRVGRETRTDELVRYLRDQSTVPVVDLRAALGAAKGSERLYHRTDTHWNDRGAFVAYRAILSRLADGVPPANRDALAPLPRTAFAASTVREPGMDLAGMLSLTDRMHEDDLRLASTAAARWRVVEPTRPDPHGIEPRLATGHEDRTRPRALVLRDSFGSALIPFLSEHFSRALYLWQYNLEPALVLEERPDVVIQEVVGRRLLTVLPYDAVAALGLDEAAGDGASGTGGPGGAGAEGPVRGSGGANDRGPVAEGVASSSAAGRR